MARRHYVNTAQPTTLTSAITDSATSIPVASTAGYPVAPFTMGIDRGDPDYEELVLVTVVVDGTTFTATRGFNGTTAVAHGNNAPVEHVTASIDYDEANRHINDTAQAEAEHSTLLNASRHAAVDHAPILVGVVPPVGAMMAYAGAVAPSGWLFCYGQTLARATYPALYDAIGTTYGAPSGSTFKLPDMRGRVMIGLDNLGGSSANRVVATEADTLGGAGGEELHTLTEAEMPTHTHDIADHAHDGIEHQHHGTTDSGSPHKHAAPSGGQFVSTVGAGGTFPVGATHGATQYTANEHDHDHDFVTSFANADVGAVSLSPDGAGGSESHQNMPPYMALGWIIRSGVV